MKECNWTSLSCGQLLLTWSFNSGDIYFVLNTVFKSFERIAGKHPERENSIVINIHKHTIINTASEVFLPKF